MIRFAALVAALAGFAAGLTLAAWLQPDQPERILVPVPEPATPAPLEGIRVVYSA